METRKISFLCKLSDRIYDNAKRAKNVCKKDICGLTIRNSYNEIKIDFDDYPELKTVAEKLIDYLVKSEERKQNELKIEIARVL